MPPPTTEPEIAKVRAAIRSLHQSAPEAAALVERWVEAQEQRITVLQSEDPFRALVLALADAMSRSNALVDDVRTSILGKLVQAEVLREERRLIEVKAEAERTQTIRGVLSQPAVIALISVLSAVLTGIIALVKSVLEH